MDLPHFLPGPVCQGGCLSFPCKVLASTFPRSSGASDLSPAGAQRHSRREPEPREVQWVSSG